MTPLPEIPRPDPTSDTQFDLVEKKRLTLETIYRAAGAIARSQNDDLLMLALQTIAKAYRLIRPSDLPMPGSARGFSYWDQTTKTIVTLPYAPSLQPTRDVRCSGRPVLHPAHPSNASVSREHQWRERSEPLKKFRATDDE